MRAKIECADVNDAKAASYKLYPDVLATQSIELNNYIDILPKVLFNIMKRYELKVHMQAEVDTSRSIHPNPMSFSVFTPQLFRMYPPADCIKDYITEGDMEDIIECYNGQALIEEELSKAELEVHGVQTWQEFVVQRAYMSYFEI